MIDEQMYSDLPSRFWEMPVTALDRWLMLINRNRNWLALLRDDTDWICGDDIPFKIFPEWIP